MITVLFVDDEPALLDVSRLYLEKTGDLKVETCFSVEQAIELLKERSYDVIVSDYEMPGIDGIEFLKLLRNLGDPTPFIIFTGRGREHVVIEALNSGADFYLQKGGDPKSQFAELSHKIRLAVERKRNERSLQITRHSVDKASIRIFWFDTRGRIIYVNEAACRALGYAPEELLRMTIGDIDPLFTKEEWDSFVQRLRAHGSMVLQAFHTRRDRETVAVEVSFTVRDFQEREIIFAYSWSAGEWAAVKTRTMQAEIRCHRVADALPFLYFEVATDGTLIFWNNMASAFIGSQYRGDANPKVVMFPDLVLKGQQAHVAGIITRVGEGCQSEIIQVPLVGIDGINRTVIFNAHGYAGEHGRNFVQLLEIPP
ncbi:MAG: osmolarity response regulator [Methanoregulaceae archaeon PtaB.Bin056]|nr:MAG: osmolarity response regulator [Methanoregulaceae archaeon PtaB.Bin056]